MTGSTQNLDATAEALESVIKGEVLRMYQEVAAHPDQQFHFFHGREAAEMLGYRQEWLDAAPAGAIQSFAGVGNPHLRSGLQAGETVVDVGSGAGLDSLIAAWQVGPSGRVIGIDLNRDMLDHARRHAHTAALPQIEFREGRMEDLPIPDATADAVISNGVVNLSFRKSTVIQELLRILRPGGRVSLADIVSAKQLSQSIVNDPKLWAA
jgi:SAM-dependent methyltransferase